MGRNREIMSNIKHHVGFVIETGEVLEENNA
jgi:hypothetical protein